jgi:hypothetical protein
MSHLIGMNARLGGCGATVHELAYVISNFHVYAGCCAPLRPGIRCSHAGDSDPRRRSSSDRLALPEASALSPDELHEEGTERDANPHAHYIAYHRLRSTGWLPDVARRPR